MRINGQSRSRRRGGDKTKRDEGEARGLAITGVGLTKEYKPRQQQEDMRVGGTRRRLVTIRSDER